MMNPEWKAKWVAALRSGEYEQGNGCLAVLAGDMMTVHYCCLGVLCEITPVATRTKVDRALFYDESDSFLPKSVEDLTQVEANKEGEDTPQIILAHMNDRGVPFTHIADWIEANL